MEAYGKHSQIAGLFCLSTVSPTLSRAAFALYPTPILICRNGSLMKRHPAKGSAVQARGVLDDG